MKHYNKILLSIIISVVFIFSSVVIVNADMSDLSEDEQKDLRILADLRLIFGDNPTGGPPDYTKMVINRIQAALHFLRLNRVDKDAIAYLGTNDFKDSHLIEWAYGIPSYLKGHKEVGFSGDGTYLRPSDNITTQELCKVVLVNLGYTQGIDFQYENSIDFARQIGLNRMISIADDNAITFTEVWLSMIEAFRTPVKDSSKTLIEVLGDKGVYTEEEVRMVLMKEN